MNEELIEILRKLKSPELIIFEDEAIRQIAHELALCITFRESKDDDQKLKAVADAMLGEHAVKIQCAKNSAKNKEAFAIRFGELLGSAMMRPGHISLDPNVNRKLLTRTEYERAVCKAGRNIRALEFRDHLLKRAKEVKQREDAKTLADLAACFAKGKQGPTRYAAPVGVTFAQKKGFRLDGK